jgi:hypothetical protein
LNLLLVGDLRYLPAEPKKKEGQMRYKIEMLFESSNDLSNEELAWLEDSLVLQVLEPVDVDGNNCGWKSTNTFIDIEKEGQTNQLNVLVDLMKSKWGDNAVEAFAGLLSTVVSADQLQVLIDDLKKENTNV